MSKKKRGFIKGLILGGLICTQLAACGAEEQALLEDGQLIVYYAEDHTYYGTALGEFYSRYQDIYDIKVVPFETEEAMHTQLQTEIAAGMGPDVVLTTANSDFDMYKMVQSGNLEPLDNYLEEDQTFHEEDYYMPIIEGGRLQGEQYIMPFSFTLDVMYVCEEEHGQYVEEEPADFNGMLKLLGDIQDNVGEEKLSSNYFYNKELGGVYVHYLVNSGMELVTEDGFASPELEKVATMVEYIMRNKAENMEKQSLDITSRKRIFDIYDSITMNSTYLSTRLYVKGEFPEGEECILTEIPWKNVNGKPQPMIVDYGFVMANSDCKKGAFALLRYLTNNDSVSMPVNRENMKEAFDYVRVNKVNLGRRMLDGSTIEPASLTKEQKDAALATLDTMDTAIVANKGYYRIIGEYMKECVNDEAVWDVAELESRVERYLGE